MTRESYWIDAASADDGGRCDCCGVAVAYDEPCPAQALAEAEVVLSPCLTCGDWAEVHEGSEQCRPCHDATVAADLDAWEEERVLRRLAARAETPAEPGEMW